MSTIALISENLEFVAGKNPDLIAGFYERLFTRYPQAKALFGRNSSENQQKMLTEALVAVVAHAEDSAWLTKTLTALGRKHVEYGVKDEMYDWVRECLVDTFEAESGERWTAELGDAWHSVLKSVNDLALQGAAQARSTT